MVKGLGRTSPVENMARQTLAAASLAEIESRAFASVVEELEKRGLKSKFGRQLHDEYCFEVDPAEIEEIKEILRDNGLDFAASLIGGESTNG